MLPAMMLRWPNVPLCPPAGRAGGKRLDLRRRQHPQVEVRILALAALVQQAFYQREIYRP